MPHILTNYIRWVLRFAVCPFSSSDLQILAVVSVELHAAEGPLAGFCFHPHSCPPPSSSLFSRPLFPFLYPVYSSHLLPNPYFKAVMSWQCCVELSSGQAKRQKGVVLREVDLYTESCLGAKPDADKEF